MPQKNSMFDIIKFCNGERSTCNNVGYSKHATSGNDPMSSNRMRYSQMLHSRRFKNVTTTNLHVPEKKVILFHHNPHGYIFKHSAL